MTIGDKIRERLIELKMNESELARASGVSQATINDLVNNKQHTTKFIAGIAAALRLTPADLDERLASPAAGYRAPPPLFDEDDRIGLFSAADAGDGFEIVSSDPLEYVPRPHQLKGIPDSYLILIANDSMIPVYEPGDKAYVNPRMPLTRGKNFIFYAANSDDGERKALIKRLVTWTDREWTVAQHNPAKQFKLKRAEWNIAHRVFGKLDAY